MSESHWTEERVAALRRYWDEGLSLSDIARTMGDLNRNQVVGKAHRLKLPKRPSPLSPEWRHWYRTRNGTPASFRVRPLAPEEGLGGSEISFVAVPEPSVQPKARERRPRKTLGEMAEALKRAAEVIAATPPLPVVPEPAKAVRESVATVSIPPKPAPKPRVAPPVSESSLERLFAGTKGQSIHFEGAALAVDGLRSSSCKWPIGDPRDGGFRFCTNVSRAKGPYCDEHFKLAYAATSRTKPRAA